MQKSINQELFNWPEQAQAGKKQARLLGSECQQCQVVQFPQQRSCPACCCNDIQIIELAQYGTLWSWTTQEFPPKLPDYMGDIEFIPYLIGYVELADQVRVESRIISHGQPLRIGMPLELVFQSLYKNKEGDDIMMYAFQTNIKQDQA